MKSSERAPVAIVGNLNLDIRTSPITPSPALLHDGETSVELLYESVGGGAANTAAAIAAMGGEPHLCCAIGDDELGQRLCRFLLAHGVRVHAVIKRVVTGRSLALTWDTHQRHFVSSLPNTRLLEEDDIDLNALLKRGCRHLYRADVWFADRMLRAGNTSLMLRAREAGMQTSLDINWDPAWSTAEPGAARTRIAWLQATLPHVSFVHGNERELAFFTGTASFEDAAPLLRRWGAGAVIVHRGARGCACFGQAGWVTIPAAPVSRIVNEAGTGDVFTAAFLLAGDLPLSERLQFSADAAAHHLEGRQAFIPRMDAEQEVDAGAQPAVRRAE